MSLSVVDTTVLSNFASLGRIQLVQEAFPDVAAPSVVFDEVAEGRRLGYFPTLDLQWLPKIEPDGEEIRAFETLKLSLGRGEAACLAVAQSRKGLLLTDDQAARRRARAVEIEISGSVGVLQRLVDSGAMDLREADRLLQRMIDAGYWSPVASLQDLGE